MRIRSWRRCELRPQQTFIDYRRPFSDRRRSTFTAKELTGSMGQVTHRKKILYAVLAAVVSAYGQDVHYTYDRDTSVASYKTYQWVGPDGTVGDQLIDRDIKRSIDEQLALQGLTKVESGADLYVCYKPALEVEKAVYLRNTGFGGRGGLGDRTLQAQTSTVPFGTLIVSLYDPARNRLI